MKRGSLLRELLRRPLTALSLIWIVFIGLVALFPSVFTSKAIDELDLALVLKGPTKDHWLGTDTLGQDVYSRLVYGTRPTVVAMLVAVVVATVLGVTLGLIAGYLGGIVDNIISRFAEIIFSIPAIIVLLVVFTVFPNNVIAAMTTFGVIVSSGLMRLVRGVTLSTKEELFVAAAQVSGLSQRQIMVRHLFPRVRGLVLVQASLLAAIAIVVQSGLAFLGFGPKPPQPTWGSLVADARTAMTRQNFMLLPTGLTIALSVFALTVIGDALRDRSSAAWAPSKLGRRKKRASKPSGTGASPAIPATPSQASDALLTVTNLSVGFPTPTGVSLVVQNVSFAIRPGETVGIVGESGCGKTVTASTILGMVPGEGEATSGTCVFEGADILRMSAQELSAIRGKRIGFVSQEPMVSLDPTWRVSKQIAEAVRRHHGGSKRDAMARAVQLLESVNIPDPAGVAKRYPHQMSGGMAQRIAIALALAGDPVLLIADEPTTALDVTVQAEILTLLRRSSRDRGMAVLLVTHNWGVVADLCDRAIVMYAGEIVESATVTELFLDARHPYTTGLLRSNPLLAKEGERLPAIAGTVPPPGQWPIGCHFQDRCPYAAEACQASVELEAIGDERWIRCVRADEILALAASVGVTSK